MGFYYPDTHYLLLAVLIEQVTQKSLHQNYKERILNPLGLSDTYLEFFQYASDSRQEVFPYFGEYPLKNVNTSFDWGGGGLMSTINDLDIFIRSLLSGKIFKDELSLKMMLTAAGDTPPVGEFEKKVWYGFGVQKKVIKECIFYGRRSAYGSLLFFDQENNISIIISLNQAMANHKADWLMNKVINSLSEQ